MYNMGSHMRYHISRYRGGCGMMIACNNQTRLYLQGIVLKFITKSLEVLEKKYTTSTQMPECLLIVLVKVI